MVDKRVYKICEEIKKNGGNCFFVGGYVRDKLLNIEAVDIDIEVFHINTETLRQILKNYKFIEHKKFGVFSSDNLTFAMPRIETKVGKKHYNFTIEINENLSIKQAALRRDFTINAIYKNVYTSEIIDPFNGIKDLKNKTLKSISASFIEDDVRILRAIRFSAMYDLKVEENTLKQLKQMDISNVSEGRINSEINKMRNAKYVNNAKVLIEELNIYEKIRI